MRQNIYISYQTGQWMSISVNPYISDQVKCIYQVSIWWVYEYWYTLINIRSDRMFVYKVSNCTEYRYWVELIKFGPGRVCISGIKLYSARVLVWTHKYRIRQSMYISIKLLSVWVLVWTHKYQIRQSMYIRCQIAQCRCISVTS